MNIRKNIYGNERLDRSAQYLIAELEALHQRAGIQEQRIANKANLFLAITTASIGGLVLASDNILFQKYFFYFCVFILLFLLLLGVQTYLQTIEAIYFSKIFYRRIGRIRAWFLDNDPHLLLYSPFTVGDNSPRYDEKDFGAGVETTLLVINASITGVLLGTIIWSLLKISFAGVFLYSWIPFLISFIASILAFCGMYYWQVHHAIRFLKYREEYDTEHHRVHFPAEEYKAKINKILQQHKKNN